MKKERLMTRTVRAGEAKTTHQTRTVHMEKKTDYTHQDSTCETKTTHQDSPYEKQTIPTRTVHMKKRLYPPGQSI